MNSSVTARQITVGVGVNSTTGNAAQITNIGHPTASIGALTSAKYVGTHGPGFHTIYWLEFGYNTGGEFQTFLGTTGLQRSGLTGRLMN